VMTSLPLGTEMTYYLICLAWQIIPRERAKGVD
jgi:hypothetical protein